MFVIIILSKLLGRKGHNKNNHYITHNSHTMETAIGSVFQAEMQVNYHIKGAISFLISSWKETAGMSNSSRSLCQHLVHFQSSAREWSSGWNNR